MRTTEYINHQNPKNVCLEGVNLDQDFLFSETKKTKTSIDAIDKMPKGQEANVLDAASQGAANAVFLVANIGGTLIAGGSKTFLTSFCKFFCDN